MTILGSVSAISREKTLYMYVLFVLKTQMSLYTCSRIEYYSRAVAAKKIICFYYFFVSLKFLKQNPRVGI